MSDTDDTDDLLLIPPDLFTPPLGFEDSLNPYGPYYCVVDNLIKQFHSLEDRINYIETTSDTSLLNSSLNSSKFMSGVRRVSSLEDLPLPGNSPHRSKTTLSSLPSTPSESKRLQHESPKAALNEINTFISHVKNIQKHDAVRNLNPVFERDGKTTVAREVKLAKEPVARSEKVWKVGETKGSVPDRGMGMRDLLYDTHLQPPSSSDVSSSVRNAESLYSDSTSVSSGDSTQLTAVQRHSTVLDVLNRHQITGRVKESTNIEAKKNDTDPSLRRKLVLMSLSELWNQDSTGDYNGHRDRLKFNSKFQEEKLRRQHCEDLIQQLQTKNLELQERLAVAVEVDSAKDEAILQIHKSWEDASTTIDNLRKEKSLLEIQITESNTKMSADLLEASKKVSHYESESSKALNLAHNNQEKLTTLEKQNALLLVEIQSYQDRLQKLELDFEREHSNNQQLSKLLNARDTELNENKNVQSQATKEIAQSKRAVEMCQTELTSLKTKQTQLETNYNEALSQIKDIEGEKKKLLSEIENYKKIEKNLKEELTHIKDTNEQSKADLRTFYQNQVEILVREKLKEFQAQLEKAETALNEEMRNRELAMAKNAAAHMQQINEKNLMEIHLLEEKHKEVLKLYKLQLFQSQQEINNLQLKFQQQQERRANIVQQLQKVMEAQWSEALKIINNGRSPLVAHDKSTNTLDQLIHLKSRSYNNLEEILTKDDANGKNLQLHASGSAPVLKLFDTATNSTMDDSYNTPVTTRLEKHKHHNENQIQKYMQMLLSKQPVNPSDDRINQDSYYELQNNAQIEDIKSNKTGSKDRLGKPPWK